MGLSHSRPSSPHIEDNDAQERYDLYTGENEGTSGQETFWMLVPGEDRKEEGCRDTEVQQARTEPGQRVSSAKNQIAPIPYSRYNEDADKCRNPLTCISPFDRGHYNYLPFILLLSVTQLDGFIKGVLVSLGACRLGRRNIMRN